MTAQLLSRPNGLTLLQRNILGSLVYRDAPGRVGAIRRYRLVRPKDSLNVETHGYGVSRIGNPNLLSTGTTVATDIALPFIAFRNRMPDGLLRGQLEITSLPLLRAQAFNRSDICSANGPGCFAGALKYAMPALKKWHRQSAFVRCA